MEGSSDLANVMSPLFLVSPLEQLDYQELQYLLLCYCPSVQSKKDIIVMKAKVQTGGFSLVSAEQVTWKI